MCKNNNCTQQKLQEFKCNNGQCIPISKRCDLMTDCLGMQPFHCKPFHYNDLQQTRATRARAVQLVSATSTRPFSATLAPVSRCTHSATNIETVLASFTRTNTKASVQLSLTWRMELGQVPPRPVATKSTVLST